MNPNQEQKQLQRRKKVYSTASKNDQNHFAHTPLLNFPPRNDQSRKKSKLAEMNEELSERIEMLINFRKYGPSWTRHYPSIGSKKARSESSPYPQEDQEVHFNSFGQQQDFRNSRARTQKSESQEQPTANFLACLNETGQDSGIIIHKKKPEKLLLQEKEQEIKKDKGMEKEKKEKKGKKGKEFLSPIDFCQQNLGHQKTNNGKIWASALIVAGLILFILRLMK